VAEHLLQAGHEVVGLDDLSGGFRDNLPDGLTFYEGSVVDRALVDRLFSDHAFEHVFHLAAYAAEGLSHFIRVFNYTNNVVGSMHLLNAAVNTNVRCVVFTSSIVVYGPGQTPMIESMTPQPEDPYGVAKYAVELDLAAARRMFGLDSIIFRPHNVYGERQHIGDRYRNVIGIFMNQLMQDQPMAVFGDGEQTRAFSHIDEVAPVMARSIDVPAARNQVFNIGADTPVSVNDLTTAVAAAMGKPHNVQYLEARQEVVHAFADHSKLAGVFGVGATISLEDGVRRMAEWARRVGPRPPSARSDIEIHKNLPPSWR
jgi:UDP-glucose 4-epimerase